MDFARSTSAHHARGSHAAGTASGWRSRSGTASRTRSRRSAPSSSCSPPSDGKLNVLDAYCRHMGGDLSQGTVKGEAIACPFHDWRWAGNGKCVQIPYAKRIPLRARTRSWLTLERNKQLFVWHDPEGNPPPDDIVIPETKGASSQEWSDWTWDTVRIDGLQLPRDHRQHGRHGPLLLHPLRVPDLLQERVRGPCRHAVPELPGPPGRQARVELLGGGRDAQVGGLVLRPVLHDQRPVAGLPRHDHRDRADQLPLPGHARTRSSCSGA